MMTGRDLRPEAGDDEYAELVRICGNLPLALRIAGALLRSRPTWTVRRLITRLADENRRLGLLQRDDLAVRPVFESSFAVLDADAQMLFSRLGCVSAIRVAPWMAAALMDIEIPDAEDLLERLVDAQLLRTAGPDASDTSRYTLHDLVRLYAREKLGTIVTDENRVEAERRLLSGYLALSLMYTDHHPITGNFEYARTIPLVWAAPAGDVPAPSDPMDWLVEERADIIAEIEHAYATRNWPYVWGLADIMHAVFILSSHGPESRRVKDLALSAARIAGDVDAELETGFHVISLLHYEFHYAEAVAELVKQREIRRSRGEARRVGHLDLIMAVVQRDGGMLRAAHESLVRSIEQLEPLEDGTDPALTLLIASAEQNLAVVLRDLGRLREADELLAKCLATFARYDDAIAYGRGLHTRAILHVVLGRYDEAEAIFEQSVQLMTRAGDRRWIALLTLAKARLADRRNDHTLALRLLDECEERFRAIADEAGLAQVLRSRAVVLRRVGRTSESADFFAAAHEALKAVHDRRSHGRLHYSRALLALRQEDWAEASRQLDHADELFNDEDDAVWRCRVGGDPRPDPGPRRRRNPGTGRRPRAARRRRLRPTVDP